MFFEYSLFILQPACLDFLRAKLSGHSKKSPFVLFVKMGCDGGTIPKRHELVKGPKKVEKVDKNAALAARWKYCALSTEKLRSPIVTCDLGRLYNKDAVIEFLLDKSADRPNSEVVSHLRGIKDIKELNLTDNPAWEGERRNTKGDRYEDMHCAMFICPVVGLEMNGKHRFCFLRTCGCVFSDRALKEVKTEICHKCGDPFKEEDLVVLNGTKEEVEKLRKIMEEKRAKAKATKKIQTPAKPFLQRAKLQQKMAKTAASQSLGPLVLPAPPRWSNPWRHPEAWRNPGARGPSSPWKRSRRRTNLSSPATVQPSAPKPRHPTGLPTPPTTSK
ncbi:replication termination factor 2 isoform X4 [Salvelinus sp. IW2-2015]|uniref:replication termination factor 2 isoform X4 n=1 Tax=Salvelinus sp. IW2-2015 TaxID=2691554 RepID=UPI000CDFBD8B|nr:protein RTF2 homolog isoform X4 [Salvelinus alpinus]